MDILKSGHEVRSDLLIVPFGSMICFVGGNLMAWAGVEDARTAADIIVQKGAMAGVGHRDEIITPGVVTLGQQQSLDFIFMVDNACPHQAHKVLDPSHIIRPEDTSLKMHQKTEYRNFEDGPLSHRVCKTYRQMHTFQTVDYVKKKQEEFSHFSRAKMTIMEAVGLMDKLVDESDPDLNIPNSVHGYQTADAIREVYPHQDWFHLIGLLHDVGKVLALWGEPQWSVVGDTFPVGCAPQKSVIYHSTSFEENPDIKDPRYNTLYGMYAPCCGLDNVLLSWGHDEYLYQVLKFNGCTIPLEGMYMVRFHSFYPWHTGGDYDHLCNEQDRQMLPWVKEFSKFDLYTKCEELPDISAMRPYYESLIAKYCPGVLCW